MGYRLSFEAERDLLNVYLHGADMFGTRAADAYSDRLTKTFELLASTPRMARKRDELRSGTRIHPVGSHIVVYRLNDGEVYILRIRHGREDWLNDDEGA